MKTLVTNYTFSAASKQVTFIDYPSLRLDQILLITNVTDNIIIYNFADSTAGGILVGNVLTLNYDTTTMSDSDRLQIFIDDYVVPSTEASLTAVQVKIDHANTLLDALTAKQTTVNLDVSAINLNTDEIEGKLDHTNTLLDNLTGNVLDIEGLVNTSNSYTGTLPNIASNTNSVPAIANDTSYLDDIYYYVTFTYGQVGSMNSGVYDIRNSLLNGIGGYSLGGYINSYNRLLSSIDTTLKNGLDVTGGSDTSVKKLASDTLASTFIAPSANRIYNIFGVSTASIGQYIQIYDVAGSTPSGTPSGIFFVPANSNFNFEFVKGIPFTNNKALIVNSITPIDYNAGNNDLFITVIYN